MRISGNLVCRKNGSTAKNFTDGKIYPAVHRVRALYTIQDDFGTERNVIPDEPCPWLPGSIRGEGTAYLKSVGVFEWTDQAS